jgi:predicted MPP superfamily phosphohydrolase
MAVAVAALGIWSIAVEPDRLVVHRIEVPLPGGGPGLDGFKIVVLSDIHSGSRYVGAEKLQKVVSTVNGLDPDVVVFLGDLVGQEIVGGHYIDPGPAANALGLIKPRLAKIAVLGNHDWQFGGWAVRVALEGGGFHVLENDALRLKRAGSPLWFAGLADLRTRRPEIADALAQVPAAEPVVVLTHSPDVFPRIPARVSLTLAGDTHGGQVRLPWLGAPIVPSRFGQRYAAGLIVEQGRRLFVTTGIGTSTIPVRFGVPPEVAEVKLAVDTIGHRQD